MKRIGNLFNRIISYENLVRAEKKARLGKTKRYGVKKFDRNPYENLVRLQKALIEDTYRTSEYCVYTIIADRGNKEREIYRLPYYPDRIVHHAIMNVIEPYLVNRFTADTFNCLKGRGIHYGVKRLKRDLKADKEGTKYCLKLDIKKFFPSIDQDVLYSQFEKIFKEKKFIHKLSYKSKNKRLASLAAYWGWCKYGNCHNLWYRFTRSYNFKDYRQKLLSSYGIKESTR